MSFLFFNKQEDVVWTKYLNRYHRYCPVDAILADTLRMDSYEFILLILLIERHLII